MTWIILTVIFLIGAIALRLVALAFALAAHRIETDQGKRDPQDLKDAQAAARVTGIGSWAFIVIWILTTFISSAHQVQAGEVGVVYQFGSIVGQRSDGFQLTWPWQSVTTQSIQVQKYLGVLDDKGNPTAFVGFSKETQDVFYKITLNYSVDPSAVQGLLRNVGSDWADKLLQARVANFLKEESVKYAVGDIAPAREQIRLATKEDLTKALQPFSINVVDFLIDNIDFDQSFKDSILAKQKAVQDAEAAQNKVQQSQAEAQQAVAVAQGQADAAVALATGQAKANDLLNASLTDRVLQNKAIDKLAGNVQIALVPSGQGLILDPSTLLKPTSGFSTPAK